MDFRENMFTRVSSVFLYDLWRHIGRENLRSKRRLQVFANTKMFWLIKQHVGGNHEKDWLLEPKKYFRGEQVQQPNHTKHLSGLQREASRHKHKHNGRTHWENCQKLKDSERANTNKHNAKHTQTQHAKQQRANTFDTNTTSTTTKHTQAQTNAITQNTNANHNQHMVWCKGGDRYSWIIPHT